MMLLSKFWFNVIMFAVIGHLVLFFIWIVVKLSPRKKDKEKKEKEQNTSSH